jgi:hypothetical protein
MSFIDEALAGLIQIEVAKANNPRAVQTVQQTESDRRTSVDVASDHAAASMKKPAISFAGVDNRILYATGAVVLGLIIFKVMK